MKNWSLLLIVPVAIFSGCAASGTTQGLTGTVETSDAPMVSIPGGVYQTGKQGKAVNVPPFQIDMVEVTVGAYKMCVSAGGCKTPKTGEYCNWDTTLSNHPINCVDWNDAVAFCNWVGKRLPSQTEWEVAAGVHQGYAFPWGNQEPKRNQLCWSRGPGEGTCAVGSFALDNSPLGVKDLAGNVKEWTSDTIGSGEGDKHVFRGGAWDWAGPIAQGAGYVNSSNRGQGLSTYKSDLVGFRCARTAQ